MIYHTRGSEKALFVEGFRLYTNENLAQYPKYPYTHVYMNSIDKLAELFESFPGIGKRQARRFVYFLLHKDGGYIGSLVRELQSLKGAISQCTQCYRFFPKDHEAICITCRETESSQELMIVEKDADFENIHKTHIYDGAYFILGGFIATSERKRSYARVDQLLARIKADTEKGKLKEVIFALSVSPEAEHTRMRLKSMLQEEFPQLKFTTLGRGLSSGTELEYSDTETLKHAFQSRISG